jgi:hypothetical protein
VARLLGPPLVLKEASLGTNIDQLTHRALNVQHVAATYDTQQAAAASAAAATAAKQVGCYVGCVLRPMVLTADARYAERSARCHHIQLTANSSSSSSSSSNAGGKLKVALVPGAGNPSVRCLGGVYMCAEHSVHCHLQPHGGYKQLGRDASCAP